MESQINSSIDPGLLRYRVWDILLRRYVTERVFVDPHGAVRLISSGEYYNHGTVVEPCTCQRDQRGKLIYKGDVVLIGTWRQQRRRGEVVFHDGCWWVQNNAKGIALLGNLENEKIQIVGNIHEREATK